LYGIPAFALKPCVVSVNLFDGWRQPLQPEGKILLTVLDGNQKTLAAQRISGLKIDVEASRSSTTSATDTP